MKSTYIYSFLSILSVILILIASSYNLSWLYVFLIPISISLISNPAFLIPPLFISSLSNGYFGAYGISMFNIYVIVFIASFILKKGIKRIRIKSVFFISFLLLFFCIIVSFCLSSFQHSSSYVSILLCFLLILTMRYTTIMNLDRLFIITYISAILVCLTFFIILNFFPSISVGRKSLAPEINPNTVGFALAQLFAIFMGLLLSNHYKKWLTLLLAFLCIEMIFLVGSRTPLISSVAAFLIIFIFISKKYISLKYKLFTGLSLIMFTIALSIILPLLDIPYLDRFTADNVLDSHGAGRFMVWEDLFNHVIYENLWFGGGLGMVNSQQLLQGFGFNYVDADNMYIDLLTQIGLMGFIIFLSFYIYAVNVFLKNNDDSIYMTTPILMILTSLIAGMGETIYDFPVFWFGIGLGFLIANNNRASQVSTRITK